MTRSAPCRGDERLARRDGQSVLVGDGEDAHEVGAQVGHEDELARGVEHGLVRVGSVLAAFVGAGTVEGEG